MSGANAAVSRFVVDSGAGKEPHGGWGVQRAIGERLGFAESNPYCMFPQIVADLKHAAIQSITATL
ncbi:hypothetical protein EHS39_12770 [Ensifer sp. MPMI2T]|nr:hypothetical protein EHS39_12770 [Ensifer sp. MPMI2T]